MALIEITSVGSALVDRLRPIIHAAERDWMAHLREEEQRSLLEMLATLQKSGEP